ncbi:hypothetical protein [Pseudomarimonas salicorniae]|uniref:Uncharacterized protein n=1 Tax=Pseudomarimonas salicorniae TaxID=2933270 RepID=A0ABT0GL84_9GAMM|nr:hypothetical protein [Lysobacter sp. CAU 1642]MCK7595297.1 hypothetical protein [Lysobacter sp. CAU 1642]
MNLFLALASGIAVLTAVVHSLLGELLIFRRLRAGSLLPGRPAPPLSVGHLRILWATWHALSLFGLGFAWLLWRLAADVAAPQGVDVPAAASVAFAASGLLVLLATRGRHPGWIALALAAALAAWGQAAG